MAFTLEIQDGLVKGTNVRTLLQYPENGRDYGVGSAATEYLSGTYDAAQRTLELEGTSKDDPHDIITLDFYTLVLCEAGRSFSGTTRSFVSQLFHLEYPLEKYPCRSALQLMNPHSFSLDREVGSHACAWICVCPCARVSGRDRASVWLVCQGYLEGCRDAVPHNMREAVLARCRAYQVSHGIAYG